MKDLANYEKQESQRIAKQFETLKSEVVSLTKDKDKLEKDVAQLQNEVIELKEQVGVHFNVFDRLLWNWQKILHCSGSIAWFLILSISGGRGTRGWRDGWTFDRENTSSGREIDSTRRRKGRLGRN